MTPLRRNHVLHGILLLALRLIIFALTGIFVVFTVFGATGKTSSQRMRLSINEDWRFTKGDPPNNKTILMYDAVKSWRLPAGNDFLNDPTRRAVWPAGNPGGGIPYIMMGTANDYPVADSKTFKPTGFEQGKQTQSFDKNEEPGNLSITGLGFLIETEGGNLLAVKSVRLRPASIGLIDMPISCDHNYQ